MSIYVMSDLHGYYRQYLQLLDLIHFNSMDQLYILGDVIDRGPDSGLLLLDVLTRSNVQLLLGNHEHMMLESLTSNKELLRWLSNSADQTIEQLTDLGMQLKDLLYMTAECPVMCRIQVNTAEYCLVHAYPPRYTRDQFLFAKDLTNTELYTALWSRNFAKGNVGMYLNHLQKEWGDTVFIIGHTPVTACIYGQYDVAGLPIMSWFQNRILNIDCGSAQGIRLGAYCLDTQQAYYIP